MGLVVHIREDFSDYGIIVLESLGSSGDLAEADFHVFGYAPLGSALVELLEDVPALGDVGPFGVGEDILEQLAHFPAVCGSGEYLDDFGKIVGHALPPAKCYYT